jgi:transposase-like protein/diadenosine tetraphosphate (Ap4A) HIT family hydrolase
MNSLHAKSPCCRAKIHRFGSRRRRCSRCKRTWSIRRKKRGRKRWRSSPGLLEAILVQGRSLKSLAPRVGLTQQAVGHRWRRALRQFVFRPRVLRVPAGPLVLILDGLYFRFRRKDWVLYMMAVKPCHQNRALFLDPVLLPGRENMQGWSQAFTTIPTRIRRRIRASVSDEISGVIKLGTSHGWIVQLCHFHLISRLQNCRGQRNRRLEGRPLREALYQQVRQALELPDGPRLQTVLEKLRRLVRKATGLRVMRMIVREFLRRIDHFTAYRKYPELDLPTTTGSVEAMNRRVRDLMRQTRSVRSPQALQLWATALIRMRPAITCNGKHFQQKKFV